MRMWNWFYGYDLNSPGISKKTLTSFGSGLLSALDFWRGKLYSCLLPHSCDARGNMGMVDLQEQHAQSRQEFFP